MVNAMPQEIQDLLLRIVKPKTLADGTPIIVTAREALAVIESVMARCVTGWNRSGHDAVAS